jgi:hypothetical protein
MFDALTRRAHSTLVSGAQDGDRGVDDLLPRVSIQDCDLGDHQITAGREELPWPSVALGA